MPVFSKGVDRAHKTLRSRVEATNEDTPQETYQKVFFKALKSTTSN